MFSFQKTVILKIILTLYLILSQNSMAFEIFSVYFWWRLSIWTRCFLVSTKFDKWFYWQIMKKYGIINSFNLDVPDENFFIFTTYYLWKKPFPEVDHLRKQLIFCIDNKTALTRQHIRQGRFFISWNGTRLPMTDSQSKVVRIWNNMVEARRAVV